MITTEKTCFKCDEVKPVTEYYRHPAMRDGQELLRHHSANEAIEEIIDGYHPDPIDGDWEISVYEYQPIKPGIDRCGSPLEHVLEILDEEYGDPDGCGHDQTETMKAAEKTFLEAVLSEYRSWMCEQTGKVVTVNALEWTKEHRPDWITAQTAQATADAGQQADGE